MCTNNSLLDALKKFESVTSIKDENDKLDGLESQFSKIAKCVFNEGYFQINNSRRIYPTVIEFYYHEEKKEGLKDPIMYHTSYHDKKCDNGNDYYPLGALNFHVSGVDVTFENKSKQYRASFLIREYDVYERNTNGEWIIIKSETRSTYIYEDMLMRIPVFGGINLQWISEHSLTDYVYGMDVRKNVASYHLVEEPGKPDKYEKDSISDAEYQNLPEEQQKYYFTYSGHKYKKCTRKWSYRKIRFVKIESKELV